VLCHLSWYDGPPRRIALRAHQVSKAWHITCDAAWFLKRRAAPEEIDTQALLSANILTPLLDLDVSGDLIRRMPIQEWERLLTFLGETLSIHHANPTCPLAGHHCTNLRSLAMPGGVLPAGVTLTLTLTLTDSPICVLTVHPPPYPPPPTTPP
jgi:hypothetical protein